MTLRELFLSNYYHRITLYKFLLVIVFLISVEIILHIIEIIIDLIQI